MNILLIKLIGVVLLFMPITSQAITLRINPISQIVSVGSSFDVAVTLSNLGDHTAPSISLFDLNVGFNTTLLAFSGATFGDPIWGDQLDLSGLGSVNSITPGLGEVNLFELSLDEASVLDSSQWASFTLATLSFTALGEGADFLSLTLNALGDASGEPLTADTINGNITVGSSISIPEPRAWLLVSLAILIMKYLGGTRFATSSQTFQNV